jgi:3-dehydrosphinganine reductase
MTAAKATPTPYQHAIITGGSSGIGKATACLLASRGLHISIIGRDEARLAQARTEIEQARQYQWQYIGALAADVANPTEIEQAIHEAGGHSGFPDLVITSAGIAVPGLIHEQPLDIFERTMAVNYFGTLYTIKSVLPSMREAGRGHLVLVASGAALLGIYGYAAYSPSKFAVRGLAETLRAELKPAGIHVSIAYPPDTDTPQLAAENKTKPAATREITGSGSVMSAEDVARALLNGIDRRAFIIAPNLEMRLLARLHSLLAPALNRYFDRIIQRHHRPRQD